MSLMKPEDVAFVFDNKDGTYTVGVYSAPPDKDGKRPIRRDTVKAAEGRSIAKAVEKHMKLERKFLDEKGVAAQPGLSAAEKRHYGRRNVGSEGR